MADQTTPQTTQTPGDTNVPLYNIHGRNGYDDPFSLRQDEAAEAINVDWFGAALARRRGGALQFAETGGTPFASGIRFLCRHVPGTDQTAAEWWGVDGTGRIKRLVAGVAWADVTVDDPITGNYGEVNAVSFNGKLFFCYQSGQNRLHVWDPVLAKIRRVGIATSAAATVANTGSGTYAATARFYKIQWVAQSGGVTIRQSELSVSVSFTPSGSGIAARVTQPTPPGESETHWVVWASADNTNYWNIGTILKATTTFDDSTAPASYSSITGQTAPLSGSFFPPPAAKYIVADTGKMIMAGCWETTGGFISPSNTRFWWTSQLGSTNVGDDERVNVSSAITSYDDVGEAITGISEPQQGSFFGYSYLHQWKYVATPSVTSPYQRFLVSGGQGCLSHKTIRVAHDDSGYPATYWFSQRGQERSGRYGNQFVGVDTTDIWNGDTQKGFAGVNLSPTTNAFSVYHQDIHQIWTWITLVGSAIPNLRVVYDTWLGKVVDVLREGAVRGGWSQFTGESSNAYCACMFSDSIGASMGLRLKPYIGYAGGLGGATQIWKCDTTDKDDNTNPFQAYIESKPLAPWGLGRKGGLTEEAILICKTDPGVNLQLTIIRDEGAQSDLTSTLSMSATSDSAQETRVFPQFDSSQVGEASTIRIRLGDREAASVGQWTLSVFVIPLQDQGER